jgi:hypothetical protein
MGLTSAVLVLLAAPILAQEGWTLLSDFDTDARQWGTETGPSPFVVLSADDPFDGTRCLRIDLEPIRTDCVRQSWGTDVSDLRWSAGSRVRFRLKGSPLANGPHGGLILVEAGGAKGGGSSHWMLPIPPETYSDPTWHEVLTAPLAEATNPDWAPDGDGKPDPARITRILFVAQQETPGERCAPYSVYLDRVEALGVAPLEARWAQAEVEAAPGHVTPIWRGFRGRQRELPAQVTFEDVTGWRVARYGGTEAAMLRSEEEPCYEDLAYQAKVTYRSTDGGGWFELVPPEPIALPEEWNAACLWIYGNNWSWVPDPGTPAVETALRVIDATGQRHRLSFGCEDFKFYGMLTTRVPEPPAEAASYRHWGGANDGRVHAPARLEAIEVRNGTQPEPRTIYLESVAFYQDEMPLPSFRPELVADLPFPTTPETILPDLAQPTRVSLQREGAAHVWTAEGDERVVWRYEPAAGTLSDLTVRVGDREAFVPCRDGGPALRLGGGEHEPDDPAVARELLETTVAEDAVTTRWRARAGEEETEYSLTLHAKGKSMVADWSSRGQATTALRLGRATGIGEHRLIRVPYLNITNSGPAVLLAGDTFALTLLDWYSTDCSGLYGAFGETPDGATMNGGSNYGTLTDGTRNPLRERQFVNVSSRFEEVLPTIANPPSTQAEVTRTHLYCHLGGTALDRFDGWLAMWRAFHRKGIEDVLVTHHEDAWTNGADVGQGGQEYTMCTEAAPEVGDEKLIAYCRAMREMGYGIGLYENFTDYNPLGKSWDQRNCTRNSLGEIWRGWPPTYAIRPYKALEMALDYPRRVAAKFGTNTAYRDCMTAYSPWGQVDFQAGSPEAGKLSQGFRAWGALLMDGHKAYGGPIFSEGGNHWFSAGLVDGNYAQIWLPDADKAPLLVDFDLRRIHPLEADIAMTPHWAWGAGGEWGGLAATIAYGHVGYQPFGDPAFAARYYYLIRALQERYVMVPVESIRYGWDGRLCDTSEVLRAGANGSRQVLVRYANGLEAAVNYDPAATWEVEVGGVTYALQGYAWAAAGPGGFVEYCTERDGRRIGYVGCDAYTFADGGGALHDFGPIETDGAVVLRKDTGKLIPLAGATQVALALPEGTVVEGFDASDRSLGEVPHAREADGRSRLSLAPEVDYCRLAR